MRVPRAPFGRARSNADAFSMPTGSKPTDSNTRGLPRPRTPARRRPPPLRWRRSAVGLPLPKSDASSLCVRAVAVLAPWAALPFTRPRSSWLCYALDDHRPSVMSSLPLHRPTLFGQAIPRCRTFYYFCRGGSRPLGVWGGWGRPAGPSRLPASATRPPSGFATLARDLPPRLRLGATRSLPPCGRVPLATLGATRATSSALNYSRDVRGFQPEPLCYVAPPPTPAGDVSV